ncbi:hypothetical protein TWF281_004845 [Arthrobotrys megalospora]
MSGPLTCQYEEGVICIACRRLLGCMNNDPNVTNWDLPIVRSAGPQHLPLGASSHSSFTQAQINLPTQLPGALDTPDAQLPFHHGPSVDGLALGLGVGVDNPNFQSRPPTFPQGGLSSDVPAPENSPGDPADVTGAVTGGIRRPRPRHDPAVPLYVAKCSYPLCGHVMYSEDKRKAADNLYQAHQKKKHSEWAKGRLPRNRYSVTLSPYRSGPVVNW